MVDRDWKAIALYLADIHAANLSIAHLKSTSKSERRRLRDIARTVKKLLQGTERPRYVHNRSADTVIKRCVSEVTDLYEKFPELREEDG